MNSIAGHSERTSYERQLRRPGACTETQAQGYKEDNMALS